MCKYCDNTESLLTAYHEEEHGMGSLNQPYDYERTFVNPTPEWIEQYADENLSNIDVCVNTLNEEPALLVTGTLPFTVPAIPIHYCPMCGRKLD